MKLPDTEYSNERPLTRRELVRHTSARIRRTDNDKVFCALVELYLEITVGRRKMGRPPIEPEPEEAPDISALVSKLEGKNG